MSRFVKVTLTSGEPFYLNPDYVAAFGMVRDNGLPKIGVTAVKQHDGSVLMVHGGPEELAMRLEGERG